MPVSLLKTPVVDTMLPLPFLTVPEPVRREARRVLHGRTGWTEVATVADLFGTPCQFGCKVYARRRGVRVEFAQFHSTTYGHRRSA